MIVFSLLIVFEMAKVAQKADFSSIPCGFPHPLESFRLTHRTYSSSKNPRGRRCLLPPKEKNTCRHPGWAENRRSWPVARRHAIVSGRGRATDRREAAQPRSVGRAGCGVRLSKNLRRNRNRDSSPASRIIPDDSNYLLLYISVRASFAFPGTIFLSPSPCSFALCSPRFLCSPVPLLPPSDFSLSAFQLFPPPLTSAPLPSVT